MKLLLLFVLAASAHAVDFTRDVRPILAERCFECHGEKKQKANLRLDRKADALKGGDDGAVIVPGKSGESSLIERVLSSDVDERMPPKGERLNAEQIATLKMWIDAGASWPDERDTRLDHWAWQPVRSHGVPASAGPPKGRTPYEPAKAGTPNLTIDAFIGAKLAANGLAMSSEADRQTLIRRLSFDLLGLPPTPERVERFVRDPDPRAYEKLVDEFLASPHYGERWARHWLDIAHYADTHGFERDQLRPNAWRYRDYVIRALNADKRYDEFLREQIAGDAIAPDDPAAVIATGFLAAGPWDFVGQVETKSDVLKRAARADDLDDMVTQVMTAACGVTINCARCHDHKLDPISQREYYSLWAVFAGVKREERPISAAEEKQLAGKRGAIERELRDVRKALAERSGDGWNLADIVGGGDGLGSGKRGAGIDPLTGKPQDAKRGYLANVITNRPMRSTLPLIDSVFVPNGRDGDVRISSTQLVARGLPKTSGQAWDAIRFGPVNSQFSTKLGDVDYAGEGHTLLALHANAGITFDLAALRKTGAPAELVFRAGVGYFGQTPKNGANFHVFVDGELKAAREGLGRDDGISDVEIALPASAQFLTLVATDGGNGIGHDQICFTDARIEPAQAAKGARDVAEVARLTKRRDDLQRQLKELPQPEKVYAVRAEPPPEIKVLRRGNPETPSESVTPGTIGCVGLRAEFDGGDAERRIALAKWITDPANPLTRRVIVNRLWHYHFGTGIVDTPSDFGLGGGKPSHPELLDWLAEEFAARGWSLKAMHRLICTSAAYRQKSEVGTRNAEVDSANRLLWRMNPRRLDAESVRDAVLAVSGKLNAEMYGPGYRDFDYEEAYAPIYRTITADKPELWRRSVYRFVVRTTPHQFLTTLDCPNPANLTPARNVTTTALQSLALLNNDFMLRQAGYFAERASREGGIDRAFALAFGRGPSAEERRAAEALVQKEGFAQLCRMLLNANEFIYID